ncbi:hypothetical protein [Phaeobacter sp. NW0010-22]|uniref:hypothetical protein n=1 Tax=Phaeobacter sp. NW0010-22 TaxID=3135907 RepID=UPI003105C0A4
MVCEAWSRLLDPFWEQAKHEVRESFAYEGLPKGYIALEAILEKLRIDVERSAVIFEQMTQVVGAAEQLSRNHAPEIGGRVSVVLFSKGSGQL